MPKQNADTYSYGESLAMLNKLQQMAIDEGNLNLALKAEELKCKIASLLAEQENETNKNNLTKILVDFINDKQSSENSRDICTADQAEEAL